MKRTYLCQLIALSLVLSVGFSGCKKKPGYVTTIPGKSGGRVPGEANASGPEKGSAVSQTDGGRRVPLPQDGDTTSSSQSLPARWDPSLFTEDPAALKQDTVYFDLDQATIKASEQGKIQSVASFMRSESRTMLKVEGHCDERGTAEYNRSLGERRALAVREYLISLGTPGERITTVSYGEDRPADPGHDEVAWAKNRRAEFVVLRPK